MTGKKKARRKTRASHFIVIRGHFLQRINPETNTLIRVGGDKLGSYVEEVHGAATIFSQRVHARAAIMRTVTKEHKPYEQPSAIKEKADNFKVIPVTPPPSTY